MLSTIIESVYSTPQWRNISGKMAKAYGSDAYLECVDQLNTAEDADEQAAKKAAAKLADLDQQLKRVQEAKSAAEEAARNASVQVAELQRQIDEFKSKDSGDNGGNTGSSHGGVIALVLGLLGLLGGLAAFILPMLNR